MEADLFSGGLVHRALPRLTQSEGPFGRLVLI